MTMTPHLIRNMILGGLAAAGLLIAPMPITAAQGSTMAGSGTVDGCKLVYTFTAPNLSAYQKDTTDLIQQIHTKAAKVSEEASRLEVYSRSAETPSKETHALRLRELRTAANDIAQDVCKLRARKYLATPWQRDITEELAANINTLNLHIADAIQMFNNSASTEQLFFTNYDEAVDQVYEISSRMERRTEQFLNYGAWKAKKMESSE